ncbi:MAG TPA: Gfo/Idh/MocA family oxidoreductase [Candidatus Hydrogenedentes bacterium]|jgi:predicted dehydrogenase|nr:MAG: putative oxidoreductase YcjS [Candidatus Hydrogenedentes bacterium ADurb.Bin170]HNZ48614.1 Gfo/Idh/MocA family oxidoreductase [Candidatus Hydrogenedentota bacterium]HOD96076.1 Gfo/Idh/MocA family oxidoreductase [Candidatus Hydrogenedentota bacterium]HOH41697.1 Gfo/Idh/MocA family oxidoreductase [Candidatus Hydrogenedentota bacterium]HOR50725.1 Gfo/Idh/MocA family oxidoreductase [Candidatus Hydrogenedentota bacterium]
MFFINRRSFLYASAAASLSPFATWAAQEKKQTYRACVIGDSQRGRYGHGFHLIWGLRNDVELVALADPDEEGARKHGEEAGAKRIYTDYREMLEKEKPDLVSVAPRWTTCHQEYLEACAAIGAHGIMEKPLTPDLTGGDAAVAALEAKNLKWAAGFNFRAAPGIFHAKRSIINERLIGSVLEVRARGKEDHRSGGEDLIVLGIHLFDLMIYFLGKPLWCEAEILTEGRPALPADVHEATEGLGPIVGDTIFAQFGFKNGRRGYFTSVKGASNDADRYGMDIYGTKGAASIRVDRDPIISYLPEPGWSSCGTEEVWQALPDMPVAPLRSPGAVSQYAPIIDDLMDAIVQDRHPAVSIQDALAATEMIQAVFASHVAGRRVAFPLQERNHPLATWH